MGKQITVSIIVPVYNAQDYLPKCLSRLCAQDECVREIILVNDGSTDNSLAICEKYAEQDSRIKIINKENGGTSAAVIDGISAASCEYIGFADSDDYIEREMFSELANAVIRSDADIAVCDYDDTDETGRFFGRRDFGIAESGIYDKNNGKFDIPLLPTMTDGHYLSGMRWNKIYRRDILIKNVMYGKRNIRVGEDIALITPVMMASKRIVYVKKVLYHYCQHETSTVHNYRRGNLDDWKAVNQILRSAITAYGYETENFDETQLMFLWQNCIKPIRHSNMPRKRKKAEYKYIGNDPYVRELLKKSKFDTVLKLKIVFRLMKLKLYGLLAFISR